MFFTLFFATHFSIFTFLSPVIFTNHFLRLKKRFATTLTEFIVSVNIFSPSEFSTQKSLNIMFSISMLLRIF